MSNDDRDLKEKLLALVKRMVDQDHSLREQFGVKDKFRFIRDKLQALSASVSQKLTVVEDEVRVKNETLAPDEVYVYVYLFNTKGIDFSTWQRMVQPSVFYEYSVNRPIYLTLSGIDQVIRSKTDKPQHAYLTVIVKKADILQHETIKKDNMDHQIAKVKEGALHFNRCVGFLHNDKEYIIDEKGKLVLKVSS